MKKCYVLNVSGSANGLEIYQIGNERQLLDRIRTLYKVNPNCLSNTEKETISKFIDGDHSVFRSGGVRETLIYGKPVYLGTLT